MASTVVTVSIADTGTSVLSATLPTNVLTSRINPNDDISVDI
jgi:hypothetical protein